MSAKFLGRGFKPQPKNNPPKGGGLNPLCFGHKAGELDEFYSPETKHQHCRQADHAAENPKISYCSGKSHGNFSKIINKKTYKNYNLKSISKLDKYAIDN